MWNILFSDNTPVYSHYYKKFNFENENKVAADNLKKALEYRPNIPVTSQQNFHTDRVPVQHAAQNPARQLLPGPAPAQVGVRQPQQPSQHSRHPAPAIYQPAVPPPIIPNAQSRFRFPSRGDTAPVRSLSTKRGRSSSAASGTYKGREGSFTTSPVFDSNHGGWNRQPPWNQYVGQQHQFQYQQFSTKR